MWSDMRCADYARPGDKAGFHSHVLSHITGFFVKDFNFYRLIEHTHAALGDSNVPSRCQREMFVFLASKLLKMTTCFRSFFFIYLFQSGIVTIH